MLGFSSQASNQLTNTESATLNNALRTSCKNIMYTIANSGYYTNTTDDSGMSNMTKLFVTIDVVTPSILTEVIAYPGREERRIDYSAPLCARITELKI